MSNQLVKKDYLEGYRKVFPKTFIDAIKDRDSGMSLAEILQSFNMYFLSYNGNKALTRCSVPHSLRKEGLWITYVLYDHTVITEWYNSDNIDDEAFGSDDNWRQASNMLVGDISISADGYWVIKGEKTSTKARGEIGITPLLRFGDNNKFQASYNEGKEWKDISGDITNNLKISKYIGINEALPTSGIAEGTIYMKGPYYDENDTNNDNPIYRMWVYAWKGNTLAWQDNGEFTSISAGVVQEKGNSTTEVMSQDAVTRELTELSAVIGVEDIEYNSSILVNQGLIASNGTIYTSSDYAAYSYSNPIKVKKGQRISVTVNQTAGAAAATLFDADDKPIRTLIPSAYVVATAETEIEDGVAYVRFCSANSTSSVFKAFVEGVGFAKDLKQIQSAIDATNGQVAELGSSVENINEKVLEFEQRKVGDFYQTAWVRASDGYISYSSGGAMTYIIYRDDIASATEVYARVCTENVIFAPIAFYSGVTPSTSNFISALNGVTDKNLHDFVGVIPEGCKSILVMNMSQHQADYDIRVNESEFVTRQELKGEDGTKETTPIFNPFAVKNQYYHFNQEKVASETFIPAQSLHDIRLAAQLGFEWIETNAWPCSDGVFITKHGSGGAFGNGIKSDNGVDYSAKKINSVSSEEVRSHITYDSQIAKYCSPIPTLDEFLAECKKYNMGVKTNNQSGLLAVMRKYLTDDKIFISNMSRGDFKGLLEVVYYPNEGYEKLEEKCNQTGYPLQVIIASGQFEGMSDDAVKAVVEWCHVRNYTVAVPYLSSMNWMRAQRLGVDVNLSCERTINSFLVGNDKNISSLSDSGITLSGSASYNAETDTIVMARNSILTIAADNIRFGAVSADICYKGMVTILIGHAIGVHSFVDIASDGNNVFSAAQAILPQNGEETTDFYIKIYAKEDNTIIKDLNVRCSKL